MRKKPRNAIREQGYKFRGHLWFEDIPTNAIHATREDARAWWQTLGTLDMRLDKEQSRKRWSEVRALWCEWDPIGVMSQPDWPRDEYDSYLGHTLRLLETGAPLHHLISYLAESELGHMGLNESPKALARRQEFAAQLRDWYEKHWPNSTV